MQNCSALIGIAILLAVSSGPPQTAIAGGESAWFADPLSIAVPTGNRSTVTAQLVGDSREDILVATNGQILLFENRGTLEDLELVATFETGPFAAVAAGNFRDGGPTEIAGAFEGIGGDSLVVWQDLGGGFERVQGIKEPLASLQRIGSGDLNSDSYTDLVVAGSGDSAYVYLGGASGLERADAYAVRVQPGCAGGNSVACLQLADVDNDAVLDIVVAASNRWGCGPDVRGAGYLLGDGDGGFGSVQWVVQETYSQDFIIEWVEVADVNGDLVPDFSVATECVDVYLGPAGSWTQLPPFEALIGTDTFRFPDIDGDSHADLVGGNGGWYFTAKGDGSGAFDLQGHVNAGIEGFSLVDLDGEGGLDLAGCDADGFLTLLQSVAHLDPASVPETAAIADFRVVNPSQGAVQLLLRSEVAGSVTLLVTDSAGRRLATRSIDIPSGLSELAIDGELGSSGVKFLQAVMPDGQTLGRKFLWLGE